MADQKITELPIKNASAIQLADYLLGIDAAEGYQMLISDLAKKIIESYAGTNLGGAGITLKAALDNIAGSMATIESSTTASKAYAVGDYLVMNGLLYKVTAAIASGGTITVGTNVLAAAVADDITAINNKIGDTALGTTAQTITGAIAEHEQDISGLNSKILYGTAQYSGLGQGGFAGRVTVDITFPTPMPNANYYASAELNAAYSDFTQITCYVLSKTTTGMTVTLVNHQSGSGTVNGVFRWVAIGV